MENQDYQSFQRIHLPGSVLSGIRFMLNYKMILKTILRVNKEILEKLEGETSHSINDTVQLKIL